MNDGTSEPRRCEVCGDPLGRSNKSGLCDGRGKPECASERTRRAHRRRSSELPAPRPCDICGRPLRRNNQTGICHRANSQACAEALKQSRRDPAAQPRCFAIRAGDSFGRWTVLEDCTRDHKNILCRCECGTEKRFLGARLVSGSSQGCHACGQKNKKLPPRPPYLKAGEVYGRLTVLEDVARAHDRVRCFCSCGVEMETIATSVKLGLTRSHGCLRQEMTTKHGFSGHPLSRIWYGMLARCGNPNHNSWDNYGGRGITVCDRWQDPWLFAEDIMREIGPRPEGKGESGRALYELDRIDNELGYQPGNVRWADKDTQRANQRTVAKLTRERDALAAELAALKRLPPPQ